MAAKILLVEDDNNLREIYEARLEAEGYTIVTAKDGEEALVIAKAEKPDLVVSDVMMPRISGFEMLDILRNTSELKYTKVIMLTALGQADDQTRATSLGADRYLVKSQVTLEDIVKAAHELIEGAPPATPSTGAPATPNPAAGPAGSAQPAVMPPQPPTPTPTPPVAPPPAPKPEPMTPVPTPSPAPAPLAPPTPAPLPINPTVPATNPVIPPAPVATPSPILAAPPVEQQAPPIAPVSSTPQPAPVFTPAPQPAMPPAMVPQARDKDEPQAAPVIPTPPVTKTPETEAEADAVPAADEQATMHTQIEDFINNNLTHPEATTANLQAAKPGQPAAPAGTPEDDALLASAVKDLTSPPVPAAPGSTATTPAPPAPATVAPQPAPVLNSPATGNSVTIANKKIIQPLKSEKPGLDELLAREEARERATSLGPITPSTPLGPPAPPEQPLASSNPPIPENPPQQPSGPDPNTIAL